MGAFIRISQIHPEVDVPERAFRYDAGLDLCADGDFDVGKELEIIPTGLRIAIPKGQGGVIYARSSWSARGLIVINSVVDAGFQGEVKIMCYAPWHDVIIRKGDRIAQIVFHEINTALPELVGESLFLKASSQRGMQGFGSSGKGGRPKKNVEKRR